MIIINLITQFFNLPTLAGIIILSRMLSKGWQVAIAVTLIILGLISGVK